jgi:thymidylate kinase
MTGLLIVLLGIDGAGKSSILRSIRKKGFYVGSWHGLSQVKELAHLKKHLNNPRETIQHLGPYSRALFVASIVFAEYEYLLMPLLDRGEIVVCDSYYYRFYAKEEIYGKSHPILFDLLRTLPPAYKIIRLNISPEEAFIRIGKPQKYEFYSTPHKEDFVSFQTRVMQKTMDLTSSIPYREINATRSPEEITDDIIAAINER